MSSIAYIINVGSPNANNGIKKQAEIWADALVKKGYDVVKYSPWNIPNWENIRLIHIFGNGLWLIETIKAFSRLRIPIVVSPIIDSYKPVYVYKLASIVGLPKLRLFSSNFALRYLKDDISKVLVRSNHEYELVKNSYGLKDSQISLLRLPSRMTSYDNKAIAIAKDDFCLHVSAFTQYRKNVFRLMQAAAKYNFRLKIAGMQGSAEETEPFLNFASQHPNIEIIGKVSDQELIKLYQSAKVFALPSIEEGVGFVALEAAAFGCNIVITNIGGPKEYYAGKAITVNPFSVDDIGLAVTKALAQASNEALAQYVKSNYSIDKNISDLCEIYDTVVKDYDLQN